MAPIQTSITCLFLLLTLGSCQVNEASNSQSGCEGCIQTSLPEGPSALTLNSTGTNNLSNLPTLSWNQNSDASIALYAVALGSVPGSDDVLNWTDIGKVNSYKFKNLNLSECRQYFPSLKSIDKAGNESLPVIMETGFYYDKTPPTMLSALTSKNFDGYYDRTVTVNWDNSKTRDNCENFLYQFSIGTTSGGRDVLNWKTFKAISKKQIRDEELTSRLNLQRGASYFTSIRAIDVGGNVSSSATSTAWHFYDPLEISSISFWGDFNDTATLYSDPACTIRATAVGSNIACVQDRSGGMVTLTNPTFPLPQVAASLENGINRLSMVGSYLESDPVSMNGILLVQQHSSNHVGWNYIMDWRNSVANSWWATLDAGANWTGFYLNGALTTISPTALFNNKLNIAYIAGSTFNSNAVLHLGSRFSENEFSNGQFGEIFILNNALSNSDRQKLEGYLACKWGTQESLAAYHPYKISCPD